MYPIQNIGQEEFLDFKQKWVSLMVLLQHGNILPDCGLRWPPEDLYWWKNRQISSVRKGRGQEAAGKTDYLSLTLNSVTCRADMSSYLVLLDLCGLGNEFQWLVNSALNSGVLLRKNINKVPPSSTLSLFANANWENKLNCKYIST